MNIAQPATKPARICKRLLFALAIAVSFLPAQAQNTTTVTNVFQNHYTYGYSFGPNNCPSGYNIPSGQYPSTYHLERGHAMHHLDPQNSSNDYWVYWAHFDSSNYGIAEVAIFKSATECGPYVLQTNLYPQYNKDGAGYGFQPGGWQSRDENIYRDAATQTYNPDGSVAAYANAYFITASNDLGTNNDGSGYANNSMAIFKMTPDYLGIDSTTNTATNGANWVFINAQREAPVMFRKGSKYFLITSQAAGWYPSQGGYGVSSNPLTGWTASPIALGSTTTYGGQTADGIEIDGTSATTYVLTFDHLGGDDSKNPSYPAERRDTGAMYLPVLLDDVSGTAKLPWSPSFTVDNVTGVLTLPTLQNLSQSSAGATATATVTSAASSGGSTYVPANSIDGVYTTRWQGSATGASSFNAAKPTNTSVLCPVTNATASTTCNPSLIVDLGSVQPVQEVDLSFYVVKGSEPYYTYKINYSNDGVTWSTLDYTAFNPAANGTQNNISSVPFSNNITIGFNALPVNFSARYVAVLETSVVQSNSTSPFYGPNLFEIAVIKSTAPSTPQPVNVALTPSSTSPSTGNSFSVGVTVTGPGGYAVPSGYVQLSAPGYVSETYGLVNGSSSFTIPAGATSGGAENITVNYRPDPTSAPIYGIGTTAGVTGVSVSAPAVPAGLAAVQAGPGALNLSWSASTGASGYVLKRSVDGGTTYTQLATPTGTTYTDSGLKNDSVNYCYTIAAVNNAGSSGDSASVCSTATANFPPTGLVVTPWASGQLYLTWANPISGQTGFLIKRSVNGGAYNTLVTTTSSIPTYIDTNLTNLSNVYCYTVAAVFNGGTSSDSPATCGSATGSFVTVPGYSFETPTIPLWSTSPSATNNGGFWTFVGNGSNNGNNSGISALSGTFTNANTPPIALGSQVGLLEGTGTITQAINGFTSGNTYTVLLAASQRQASAYQAGGANPISILVNGTSIGTVTPPQATAYYRDYGAQFTANASTNTLQLAGTNSNGASAVLVDNVRIVATGATNPQINVPPTTVSQDASSVTLTATASVASIAPAGSLVFQVGSGSQVAGTCMTSNGTFTCQAVYPTSSLVQGSNTVTVTYAGDSTYSPASATGMLTVTAAAAKAALTSPTPGSTLPDTTTTFSWTAGTNVTSYQVYVGSYPGGLDYYAGSPIYGSTSLTVSGLPSDGSPVYVRLYSNINGTSQYNDYTYTAFAQTPVAAVMTSPVQGSALPGTTATFNWTAGTRVSSYQVYVGSYPGGLDYYSGSPIYGSTSLTVSGLPSDGSTVYVRLYSNINGTFQYNDYTYTAAKTQP